MPRSPDPHTTSRPSSVMTLAFGDSSNDADSAAPSAVVVLDPIPIASDEPSASTMIRRGLWRSKPSLVSFDQITPEDKITRNDEMSQRSGSASRARRIGLANASPTM